jgi:5-methylcytosine-specific restriction endonuclease McrA
MENDFNIFISHLKLSEVKLNLLKRLWTSGNTFPKDWVKSSELLTLTNQKYFDRRLRELRDSGGIDLETKPINGEHCWRLNSKNISQIINRTYLTTTQKKELFEQAKHTCSICGKFALAGVRGLQADHRVPLSRGGSEELRNWQPICNECNVVKRRQCQDCTLNCQTCSWAYPEKSSKKLLINIPKDLSQNPEIEHLNEEELEEFIVNLLRKCLD